MPGRGTTLLRGQRTYQVEGDYLLLRPDGVRRPPVVLLLHGRGDTAEAFLDRMEPLGGEAALLSAGGPLPEVQDREGAAPVLVRSWYAYDGNQERFHQSLIRLESYLEGLLGEVARRADVDTSRLVVVGYSMGAYVGGFFALRRSPLPIGLALLSGRLKHEFLADSLERANGLPVLMVSGRRDRLLARDRFEEGRQALLAHGARVHGLEHDGGHGLPPDVVEKVARFTAGVIAGEP